MTRPPPLHPLLSIFPYLSLSFSLSIYLSLSTVRPHVAARAAVARRGPHLELCGLVQQSPAACSLQPGRCWRLPACAAVCPCHAALSLTRRRLHLRYVEALITVIVEVAGASIFGYMIGNIASVIADFDQFGAVQKQRMEEIKSYLSYKRVPKHLSKQVRKYYGHYYDKRGCEELKQDWSALPNILKAELVKFENKEFVEQFKCFLPVGGYDFVEVLVDKLRPLLVDVGGIVAGAVKQPPAPSPPSCDFFLICTGEVHKLIYQDPLDVPLENGNEEAVPPALVSQESRGSSNASRLVRAMRPGEWFGHVELITAFDDLEEGGSGALQWQHEPRSMSRAASGPPLAAPREVAGGTARAAGRGVGCHRGRGKAPGGVAWQLAVAACRGRSGAALCYPEGTEPAPLCNRTGTRRSASPSCSTWRLETSSRPFGTTISSATCSICRRSFWSASWTRPAMPRMRPRRRPRPQRAALLLHHRARPESTARRRRCPCPRARCSRTSRASTSRASGASCTAQEERRASQAPLLIPPRRGGY